MLVKSQKSQKKKLTVAVANGQAHAAAQAALEAWEQNSPASRAAARQLAGEARERSNQTYKLLRSVETG